MNSGSSNSTERLLIKNPTSIYQSYNLKFEDLNNRLKAVKREFGLRRAVSSQTLTGETRTFAEILDQEVEKIVLFYLRVQGELADKLWELRYQQITNLQEFSLSVENIENMFQKYRELSKNVLELLEYLDFNVIGLRKIIRKHDTLFDQKMGSMYFDSRIGNNPKNSQLVQLYHQEGVRAIIGTIRRGFEDLYDAKDALQDENNSLISNLSTNYSPQSQYRTNKSINHKYAMYNQTTVPKISYKHRLASFNSLQKAISHDSAEGHAKELNKISKKEAPTISKKNRNKSMSNFIASNFIPFVTDSNKETKSLKKSISDLEPLLKQINDVANRVMQSQKLSTSEYMATHSIMALDIVASDFRRDDEISDDLRGKTKTSPIGLYLNLFVTFLYMANQYVVAPSSGHYADLLGMSPSMSGLIIGLTPTAALVTTLLYSMWTNHSFKKPLLMCIVCAIFGNLFYGMALQCGSISMLFVGRLLTGFSGPRVISRRYIADHVSLEDRTLASSQFVTAGAMGLAFGPLVASLVATLNYKYEFSINLFSPNVKLVLFLYQTETAPGWIMGLFWIGSLIVLFLFFEEPIEPKTESENNNNNNNNNNNPTFNRMAYKTAVPSDGKGFRSDFDNLQNYEYKPVQQALEKSNRAYYNNNRDNNNNYGAIPAQSIVFVESGSELAASPIDQTLITNKTIIDDSKMYKNKKNNSFTKSNSLDTDFSVSINNGNSYFTQLKDNSSDKRVDNIINNKNNMSPLYFQLEGDYYNDNIDYQRYDPINSFLNKYCSWISWDPYCGLGCFSYITLEVHIILLLYLVNKTGQEMAVSSIPILTQHMFNWSNGSSGYYMAALGGLVLPANILLNVLVKDVEDRDMVLRLSYLSLASVFIMLNNSLFEYSIFQYIIGSSILFASLNSLEGFMMSLLSKVVSPELAKGTFNSGLLATEAGTLGRVFGDMAITVFGGSSGPERHSMVNLLYFPIAIGLAFSILVVIKYFDRLNA